MRYITAILAMLFALSVNVAPAMAGSKDKDRYEKSEKYKSKDKDKDHRRDKDGYKDRDDDRARGHEHSQQRATEMKQQHAPHQQPAAKPTPSERMQRMLEQRQNNRNSSR